MALGTPHLTADEVAQPQRHGFDRQAVPLHLHGAMQETMWLFEDIRAPWAQLYPSNPAVLVVSGYRSEAYNVKIGGSRDSQHVKARALDLRPANGRIAEFRAMMVQLVTSGRLARLGGYGLYDTFVHVDTRARKAGGAVAKWDERTAPGKDVELAAAPEGKAELVESRAKPSVPSLLLWSAVLTATLSGLVILIGPGKVWSALSEPVRGRRSSFA